MVRSSPRRSRALVALLLFLLLFLPGFGAAAAGADGGNAAGSDKRDSATPEKQGQILYAAAVPSQL